MTQSAILDRFLAKKIHIIFIYLQDKTDVTFKTSQSKTYIRIKSRNDS